MEQVTTYILTDEDKELLKKKRRPCPCNKCGYVRTSCCGCKEYSEYADETKVYEKANLLEIANLIDIARKNEAELRSIAFKQKETLEKIPTEIMKTLGSDFWDEFDATLGEHWQDRLDRLSTTGR